ncbi:hypothetical protein E2C01_018526 [Portunus trituberculatus]|uniref:Uncharacterized protein n=1 Tax=Portunus trituberculatus TaxID=210409 RepID=A0A5B7DWQ7_PORTR|nr:hypothetical protein [Portunus trituberculatus]
MLLNPFRSYTLPSSFQRLIHLLTVEELTPVARAIMRMEFPSTHMATNLVLIDKVVGVDGHRFMDHISCPMEGAAPSWCNVTKFMTRSDVPRYTLVGKGAWLAGHNALLNPVCPSSDPTNH